MESMLINNIYGRFASFFKNHELKEADKYIKRVFPNAEFYLDYEHALVFERIGEDEEIDLDYHTVINGVAYDGTFTSNYNELVKYFDESKAQEKKSKVFTCNGKKYEQETHSEDVAQAKKEINDLAEKIDQYKKHILERNCRFLDVENYSLEHYLNIDSFNYGMNYKGDLLRLGFTKQDIDGFIADKYEELVKQKEEDEDD